MGRLTKPTKWLEMVYICSELNLLTGIAAILTYPLDVEIVEMEEREEKARLEELKKPEEERKEV